MKIYVVCLDTGYFSFGDLLKAFYSKEEAEKYRSTISACLYNDDEYRWNENDSYIVLIQEVELVNENR